jgi:hypothetical protein
MEDTMSDELAEDLADEIEAAPEVKTTGERVPTYVADEEEIAELASVTVDVDNNVRIPMSLWIEVKHYVKRRRANGDRTFRSGRAFVMEAVVKVLAEEREKDRISDRFNLNA